MVCLHRAKLRIFMIQLTSARRRRLTLRSVASQLLLRSLVTFLRFLLWFYCTCIMILCDISNTSGYAFRLYQILSSNLAPPKLSTVLTCRGCKRTIPMLRTGHSVIDHVTYTRHYLHYHLSQELIYTMHLIIADTLL